MTLRYLPSATRDLAWLRRYYAEVFPQGAARAREQVVATEVLLLDNPEAGRPPL